MGILFDSLIAREEQRAVTAPAVRARERWHPAPTWAAVERHAVLGRREHAILALGGLGLALALAVGAVLVELGSARSRFEEQATAFAEGLLPRLFAADATLTAFAGLYRTTLTLEPAERQTLVAEILTGDTPATAALHLQAMGTSGTPEAPGMVVDFVAPAEDGLPWLLDTDFTLEPDLDDALRLAVADGRVTRSQTTTLPRGEPGYYLFMPLVGSFPSRAADDAPSLRGAVAIAVDLQRLLAGLPRPERNLTVALVDRREPSHATVLIDRPAGQPLPWLPGFRHSAEQLIHGERLLLDIRSRATASDVSASSVAIALLTALVMTLVATLVWKSQRVSRLKVLVAHDAGGDERHRTQLTLQSIADGVITSDQHGRVDYMNSVAAEMIGCSARRCIGRPITELFTLLDEREDAELRNPILRCLGENAITQVEESAVLVRRDGQRLAVHDTAAPIHDRNGRLVGAVLIVRDVGRERRLAQKVALRAVQDDLTGLLNRRGFEQALKEAFTDAKRQSNEHALCYLDLDEFKIINDTCGHGAGDELLRQLADKLQQTVRKEDVLARLGGDEFGLLLRNCPLKRAEEIAWSVRDDVRELRFEWEDKTFTVGVSIGVVAIDTYSESITELMSAADSACYIAKDLGRNRVHVYSPDDTKIARRLGEMQWPQRIREALHGGGFRLYGQAMRPLSEAAGEVEIVELLLRLEGKDGEMVAPMAFIPAAERYNLMREIDAWVIEQALLSIAARPADADGPRRIYTINLSGQSLDNEELAAFIRARIDRYGVDPSQLCFEITETSAIANMARATRLMHDLRALGCCFALDDFGTGLSSFAYLKKLPVDYLKIDGEFVRDILKDPVDHAMVDTINNIGHVLSLKTIAEGVETEEILAALREIGVDFAQGYLIGKPEPLQG